MSFKVVDWVQKAKPFKISDLLPFKLNAKEHPEEQIRGIVESIKKFGIYAPVVIDREMVIIAGHGRIEAAKRLGIAEFPCIQRDDLTDDEVSALRLIDNRIAETGWDASNLKIVLEDLNFDFTPYSIDFADILPEILSASEKDDNIPEQPETPITKVGDLWNLGKHQLLCGDALSRVDVEKIIEGGGAVDAVFTDPPYNVDYEGKTKDKLKINNDQMSDGNFYEFLFEAFQRMYEVTKPGGAIYVCHADSEGLNFRKAMKDSGWGLKQCIIWVKNCLVMGRQDYQWRHEPILYGWKPGASHSWYGGRNQDTIWEINKPSRSSEHPTMKPVQLVAQAIKNSTSLGDTVFDPFGGSGSTLIACAKLGRVCKIIELDPRYCDVIVKRWEEFTGEKARRSNV